MTRTQQLYRDRRRAELQASASMSELPRGKDFVVHLNGSVHAELKAMCESRGILMGDLVERLIRAEIRKMHAQSPTKE